MALGIGATNIACRGERGAGFKRSLQRLPCMDNFVFVAKFLPSPCVKEVEVGGGGGGGDGEGGGAQGGGAQGGEAQGGGGQEGGGGGGGRGVGGGGARRRRDRRRSKTRPMTKSWTAAGMWSETIFVCTHIHIFLF